MVKLVCKVSKVIREQMEKKVIQVYRVYRAKMVLLEKGVRQGLVVK